MAGNLFYSGYVTFYGGREIGSVGKGTQRDRGNGGATMTGLTQWDNKTGAIYLPAALDKRVFDDTIRTRSSLFGQCSLARLNLALFTFGSVC